MLRSALFIDKILDINISRIAAPRAGLALAARAQSQPIRTLYAARFVSPTRLLDVLASG
jgi:hypothetical protein